MCGPIVGIVLSVVSSLATAAMGAQMAKQQAEIEQSQLRVEMENERIKSIGDTTDRLMELRKSEAMNMAALSASGLDENVSYTQGIVPFNMQVAGNDIGRTIFNSDQVVGRKKYEIGVAKWKAKATAVSGFVQAGFDSLGTIAGGFVKANTGSTASTATNRIQ